MISSLPREIDSSIDQHRSKDLPRQILSQDEQSEARPPGIELRIAAVSGT